MTSSSGTLSPVPELFGHVGYDVENYMEFHIILTMAARPPQAWILSQAQDHQATALLA